jgi:hypothetical protein
VVQRTTAGDKPFNGTAQGAAVKRTMADDKPPGVCGKSSGTVQGAAVLRTTAEDEPPSM